MFHGTAVLKVGGDAGRAERVAAGRSGQARGLGARQVQEAIRSQAPLIESGAGRDALLSAEDWGGMRSALEEALRG